MARKAKYLTTTAKVPHKWEYVYDKNINFIKEPKNSKSNYWLQAVIVKDVVKRDEFLDYTNAKYLEQKVVNITSSIIV